MLTYHNDNMRTGENLSETILTPSNVDAQEFGKLAQLHVDGAVYAQPLYKANVAIPNRGTHNVLFVATENDSVYAFDADTYALLWHDSFIDPAIGITPVSYQDVGSDDIVPEIGITGTPVIDPATNTLFVVDKVKDIAGASPFYFQELQALDLATGAEKLGGPMLIQASVAGRGAGSVHGRVAFDAFTQNQRSGLLLDNGVVYIAWASHGDNGPYHGWLMAYSAQNLHQLSVYNTTPNGTEGGIWMSGGAPAADASQSIFIVTANGTFDTQRPVKDFGDSVVKLSEAGGLRVLDYFTPKNQAFLSTHDLDLGSGGVLVLPDQPGPHRHLLVTAGKQGTIYIVDRDNLGQYGRGSDRILEEIPGGLAGSFSTPAYFNHAVYYVGTPLPTATSRPRGEVLKEFPIINGTVLPAPAQGQYLYGLPGSTPSISANGNSGGIVWTLDTSAFKSLGPAILRAYDATNVSRELYDSTQAGARDQAGPAVKFAVPTVINGKVYVGGFGAVTVYGLLPRA
jgi:hypothetical protein